MLLAADKTVEKFMNGFYLTYYTINLCFRNVLQISSDQDMALGFSK